MTVAADDYAPAITSVSADRTYTFTWSFIDDASIEVFEILDTGERVRARAQDYYIVNRTPYRSPTKEGGEIVFTRAHGSNVEEVSIERNTLIAQLSDFPTDDSFNTRMIEYLFDKATMILQEIDSRKCSSSPVTPITQNLIFGSYWAIAAAQIDSALDKLYQIALEIDQSADDCRGNPEGT